MYIPFTCSVLGDAVADCSPKTGSVTFRKNDRETISVHQKRTISKPSSRWRGSRHQWDEIISPGAGQSAQRRVNGFTAAAWCHCWLVRIHLDDGADVKTPLRCCFPPLWWTVHAAHADVHRDKHVAGHTNIRLQKQSQRWRRSQRDSVTTKLNLCSIEPERFSSLSSPSAVTHRSAGVLGPRGYDPSYQIEKLNIFHLPPSLPLSPDVNNHIIWLHAGPG